MKQGTLVTWAPGMRALCAAAAMALAIEAGTPRPEWIDDAPVAFDVGFIPLLVKHRVASVVLPVLESMGAPADVQRAVGEIRWRQQRAAFRAAFDQQRVVAALTAGGVRAISVKGLCLASQTTGDMTARGVGDMDVLIDLPDAALAYQALSDSGISPLPGYCPTPTSPLFAAATRAESQAVFRLPERDIDLHWRLDPVVAGLQWTFDDLWSRRTPVDVGGRPFNTLSPVDAGVFSAANGARDTWSTLRQVIDHIRLLRLLEPTAGRARAAEVGALARWDTAGVVAGHLTGCHVTASARARRRGERMWEWLARGESPGVRGGVRPVARRFWANVGLYDSGVASLRRLETHVWPVGAMASRRLGDAGDAHPWLYAATAPLMVPTRIWTAVTRD